MECAASVMRTLDGPWVLAADFNVLPAELAGSGWLELVGGVIRATELATCNDATYDFFVVHRSLQHAVAGVQRLDGAGLHPHHPVRLLLKGNARRYLTRQLRRPGRILGDLPAGPTPPPLQRCEVSGHIEAGDLGAATVAWHVAARRELSTLVGESQEHRTPSLRWAAAVPAPRRPM